MLKITKVGFPSVLKDNDVFYLNFITDALKHADPEAEIKLFKNGNKINVNVSPSDSKFRKDIIYNLLGAHHFFLIKIIFSKSLAREKTVNYQVIFD